MHHLDRAGACRENEGGARALARVCPGVEEQRDHLVRVRVGGEGEGEG